MSRRYLEYFFVMNEELQNLKFHFDGMTDKRFLNLTGTEIHKIIPEADEDVLRVVRFECHFNSYARSILLKNFSLPPNDNESEEDTENSDKNMDDDDDDDVDAVMVCSQLSGLSVSEEIEEEETAPEPCEPDVEDKRYRDSLIAKLSNRALSEISQAELLENVQDLDLEELLLSCVYGRGVLNSFVKNKKLTEDERLKLCHTVLLWVFQQHSEPDSSVLTIVTAKILQLFKGEKNVYYVPVGEENDGTITSVAQGKLLAARRTIRAWMVDKGIAEPLRQRKRSRISDTNRNVSLRPLTKDDIANLLWIRTVKVPLDLAQVKWKLTCPCRLEKLRAGGKSHAKLKEYTDEYTLLKQSNGYIFICIDFDYLHPDEAGNLAKNWPKFSQKLFHMITKKRGISVELKELKRLNTTIKSKGDSRDLLALLSLSVLLPAKHQVKFGKKSKKPSEKEAREAFIIRLETAAQMVEVITAKQKESQLTKIPIQPFMAYVGPSAQKVKEIYICIDDFCYKADNVLHALDICFKCFFALNVEYPPQARHIWLLLQKSLYNIELESNDRTFLNVIGF